MKSNDNKPKEILHLRKKKVVSGFDGINISSRPKTPVKFKPSSSTQFKKSASAVRPKKKAGTKAKKPSFRMNILPKSGFICVAVKEKDEIFVHYWFTNRKDAVKSIKKLDVNGSQVYIAQASFKNKRRTQANAAFIRVYFMDIDCGFDKHGKPKPYPTQADGEQALLLFCKETGLPIPAIVNSGNGLYALWLLTSDVPAATWQPVARKLQKLVRAKDPGLDNDDLIADSARILRPVGSTHRKDPKNTKTVELLQDCEPIEFEVFESLIDKALASLPPAPTPAVKAQTAAKGHTEKSEGSGQYKPSSAYKIAEECPAIARIKETKGDVSEPFWYAAIGLLRHCVESPDIIHEWSTGHPGYSGAETDNKIAQHKVGPTTCNYISGLCPELCNECKYQGTIKSPITLGVESPTEIPDYIMEMNNKYFVGCFGGKTVVCKEVLDKTLDRNLLETSSFQDIRNLFNNKKVIVGKNIDGSAITKPLGDEWLLHESRRQYMEICMLPEGNSAPEVYNLWRGFSVEPDEGSWELMRKHIKFVICNGDKKLYKYVICWLAKMVQKPWIPGEVALVLRGGKGIGKGTLGNAICRIMGQHACHVMSIKDVTGEYNSHLEDCIFFFSDEAFWAGDKSAEGNLQGMITEPTVFIHRKYCHKKHVRNMLHIFMASNNDWVVPASHDERRYCVLNVSEQHKNDRPYFDALAEETNNGGLAAMLHYLINLDTSKFDVRTVPQTEGLMEQKLESLEPVMKWWHEKLTSRDLLPGHGWDPVQTQALHEDYVKFAQMIGGSKWRLTPSALRTQLDKVMPKGWPRKARQPKKDMLGKRPHFYEFPKLAVCREQFKKWLGVDNLPWD